MAVISQKMITELDVSKRHLDAALAEFTSMERMSATDSYVMGHIKCCLAGIESATDFIQMHLQAQVTKPAKKAFPPK